MKDEAGPDGAYVAGGTDLYPNMKRRQQEPRTVISLMKIPELRRSDSRTVGRSDGGIVLGAEFLLVGPQGERAVPAARLYANDGINYLTKQPDEILALVRLPAADGWDAVYHKLRRRGSFDFPVLGVAVWLRWDARRVAAARLVLGGVASLPQEVAEAGAVLTGTDLSDEAIAAAAEAAYRPAKPLDNTDFGLSWRKQMTRVYVKAALAELRARRR